jgi:hypothetical protein
MTVSKLGILVLALSFRSEEGEGVAAAAVSSGGFVILTIGVLCDGGDGDGC